jgi:hypothetical protein
VFCLALLVGGGHVWDAIAGAWIDPSLAMGALGPHPTEVGPFELTALLVESAMGSIKSGVLHLDALAIVDGTVAIMAGIPTILWSIGAHWFVLLFGAYALVVLSVSIGIQCRFEAIVVAEFEPPTTDRLISDTVVMAGNFIVAWATPLIIAGLLGISIMLAGLVLLNIPVIDMLGGVLWGGVMLLGIAMAITLLGLAVGGWLLLPAVAVDGCAGPDAMHRAFSGATSRPLLWLWYLILIVVGLGLGLIVVETVAAATVALTSGLGGTWVFNDVFGEAALAQSGGASEASWTTAVSASFIAFWGQLLSWLVAGWVLCYFAAATTRAWIMLRLTLDGIAKDDIWRPGLMPGTLAPLAYEHTHADDADTDSTDLADPENPSERA